MVFSISMDVATPADHTKFKDVPGYVRDTRILFRERLDLDHYFPAAEGGSANIGFHRKCTLIELAADPDAASNCLILYSKDGGGTRSHLYSRDGDDIMQLTWNAEVRMHSGTLATIPTGWQLADGTNSTPNLVAKFIRGVATGATNPGSTGGADSINIEHSHAKGTLTAPEHTHPLTTTLQSSGDGGGATALNTTYTTGAASSTTITGSTATALSTTQSILPTYHELAFVARGA